LDFTFCEGFKAVEAPAGFTVFDFFLVADGVMVGSFEWVDHAVS
jgi:hypothetical protein